VAAAVVFER